MDQRPLLNKNISIKDFEEFYWLKKELQDFCKSNELPTLGSKIEIANRIKSYLKTGEIPKIQTRKKSNSKFDWVHSTLSRKTRITNNYRNTENVRSFFEKEIGSKFKFNVQFMNWMKTNQGKFLDDAIATWYLIQEEKKKSKGKKDIAAQFEYNTYLRDFLAANPNLSRPEAIRCWKIKRSMRGHNRYEASDLKY